MITKLHALGFTAVLALGASPTFAADTYKFETAGCLSGDKVAVRLIDQATGKSVTDAQLFAIHRQWLPGKGALRFMDQRIPLKPYGEGRFTYEGSEVRPGADIKLVAQLDGADIPGSTTVC